MYITSLLVLNNTLREKYLYHLLSWHKPYLSSSPVDEKTSIYEQDRAAHDQRNQRTTPKDGVQRSRGKGPNHHKLIMRDIQYSTDTVLKAESHSDQGVDATRYKPFITTSQTIKTIKMPF
jgi:hypothetical protein